MDASRVESNGEVAVWKKPSIVLLQVYLIDSAITIENALSRLKLRVETARNLLKELKASDIEIGPFVLDEVEDADELGQARIVREAAVLARPGEFVRPVRPWPQNEVDMSVFTVVTAQWTIQGDNDEERLIFVANLKRSLAGIGGASNEQQEDTRPAWPTLKEELQSIMAKMSKSGLAAGHRRKRGIPRLYFLTTLGEEDELKAVGDAISRARAHAERSARAVGKTLGEIAYLSHSYSFEHNTREAMQKYISVDRFPRICYETANHVSDDMRAVQFVIKVSAQFRIERASD